jgi:hypothetical protein
LTEDRRVRSHAPPESEQSAQETEERSPVTPAVAQIESLQRSVGNRAVARLLQRVNYAYATESAHYSSSRDEAHSSGKAALLTADTGGKISRKLYGKHNSTSHSGKLVTSFQRSGGGYLVVVTYADLQKGELKYDTAFFSSRAAAPGERSSLSYNPPDPIDD